MSAELETEAGYWDADGTQTGQELRIFARMVRIRLFEEKLQELFAAGRLPGFVHLYVGEEASRSVRVRSCVTPTR
jgi:TPP-dependent pyruvate/acetoin dehydrogenase alpha subunit